MAYASPRDIRRFLFSEYYLLNSLILLTYVWLRSKHQHDAMTLSFALPNLSKLFYSEFTSFFGKKGGSSQVYTQWEWQLFATLSATTAWRIYRASTSIDSAFATAFGYAQLFVAGMAFASDPPAFVHYLLGFFLVFLLFRQPVYQGSWQDDIETLTPLSLKERALTPGQGATIVFFHAEWSNNCRQTYSTFVELAHKYGTEKIRFCRIDVDTWPHIARQQGMEVSPLSPHLPTVVLFENGEELRRLPSTKVVSASGGRKKGTGLRLWDMVHMFELDVRLACSGPRLSKIVE